MRRNQEIEFIPLQSIFASLQGSHQPFQARGCFWSIYRGIDSFAFHFQFQQDHNHRLSSKQNEALFQQLSFVPLTTPAGVVGKIWSIIIATHSSHVVALSTTTDAVNQLNAAQSILKRANGETLSTAHSRIHCTLYSTHSVHTQYVHTSINSINAIDSGQ